TWRLNEPLYFNVARICAEQLKNATGGVIDRHGTGEVPAVGAIAGPPKPKFNLVGFSGPPRARPGCLTRWQVVRVEYRLPFPTEKVVLLTTEIVQHAPVHVFQRAVRAGRPDLLRN